MLEEFFLWEYEDLSRPGTIEATKSKYHGFVDTMNLIGTAEIDIKEIRLGSGGLPILPLKLIGELEEKALLKSGKSKAKIHMVRINDFPFGFLVEESEEFLIGPENIYINGRERIPLNHHERGILESMGIASQENVLSLGYGEARGKIEAHNSTISPKDKERYCFSNICFRDYFSF